MQNQAYIQKIEYYLPEKRLTNDELAKLYPEWTAEKIYKKVGIKSRPIAGENETAVDMAEKVCKKLLDSNKELYEQIDFLILMTESPDYKLPPSSCILQHRLGLRKNIGAFDINLGCSAYIYGLAVAKSLVVSGIASNVLLVTSETYSKYIHPMDKSTRTLFGDAASATVISTEGALKIGDFDLGTDGSDYDKLIVPAGMSRLPSSEKTREEEIDENGYVRTKESLYMEGTSIFSFTIGTVVQSIVEFLGKNNLQINDIDLFVFHQANEYILNYMRKKLNIPREKFYIDLEEFGNTVSSSLPIALKNSLNNSKNFKSKKIMLTGFGVGLSWGTVILEC